MKHIIKQILSLFFPRYLLLGGVKGKGGNIALTFDDGPHPLHTKTLLDILQQAGARATFFVSGENIKRYPALIQAVSEAGHDIGNHSFSHRRASEIGQVQYWKDVMETNDLIKALTKKTTPLFRAPYGEFTVSLLRGVCKHKLTLVGWSVDSNDSYIKDKNRLIKYMQSKRIRQGDIVLFHEDYATTIEAIREIIKDLKGRGFNLVTISELREIKS